jgi:hypothetical protein
VIEEFLTCDAARAWELTSSLHNVRLTRAQETRVYHLLREHPDEERRAATAQFLWSAQTSPAVRRMLIECFEDRNETHNVRGRAAEALSSHGGLDAFRACIRQLSDPDARVRFWAVFALGNLAMPRRYLWKETVAALMPMVDDAEMHPEFWSVGYEARAMLELFVTEERRRGEAERAAILANPEAPPDLRRWAEFYSSGTP